MTKIEQLIVAKEIFEAIEKKYSEISYRDLNEILDMVRNISSRFMI